MLPSYYPRATPVALIQLRIKKWWSSGLSTSRVRAACTVQKYPQVETGWWWKAVSQCQSVAVSWRQLAGLDGNIQMQISGSGETVGNYYLVDSANILCTVYVVIPTNSFPHWIRMHPYTWELCGKLGVQQVPDKSVSSTWRATTVGSTAISIYVNPRYCTPHRGYIGYIVNRDRTCGLDKAAPVCSTSWR